jgi:hypothetical protein
MSNRCADLRRINVLDNAFWRIVALLVHRWGPATGVGSKTRNTAEILRSFWRANALLTSALYEAVLRCGPSK